MWDQAKQIKTFQFVSRNQLLLVNVCIIVTNQSLWRFILLIQLQHWKKRLFYCDGWLQAWGEMGCPYFITTFMEDIVLEAMFFNHPCVVVLVPDRRSINCLDYLFWAVFWFVSSWVAERSLYLKVPRKCKEKLPLLIHINKSDWP